MAEIPYVCLYRSYYEELENFSPEERGRLLWALLEYLCTGQEPELPEPERYFWPRLEQGGYLLLHDWGNPKLPGVAKALVAYEVELGCKIPASPMCDVGGTLVLCK